MKIKAPLIDSDIEKLKAGDRVLISGMIYSFRDAAHKRLNELIEANKPLPIDLAGQIVYYMGPTPAKPNEIIGSCGPTTAGRMDIYTPKLLSLGLKGMIGKGSRSQDVVSAIKKHKAVYFAAGGGFGALLNSTVKKCKVIDFEDLGPEAIHQLEVEDFPVIVINDCQGNDFYKDKQCLKK